MDFSIFLEFSVDHVLLNFRFTSDVQRSNKHAEQRQQKSFRRLTRDDIHSRVAYTGPKYLQSTDPVNSITYML